MCNRRWPGPAFDVTLARGQSPECVNGVILTLEGPHFLNYLEGPEGVIFDL